MERGQKRRENRLKRDAQIRAEFHAIREKKNAQGLRPAIEDTIELLASKYALEVKTIDMIIMERAQYNPDAQPKAIEQLTLFDQSKEP